MNERDVKLRTTENILNSLVDGLPTGEVALVLVRNGAYSALRIGSGADLLMAAERALPKLVYAMERASRPVREPLVVSAEHYGKRKYQASQA